ncbi:MAG: type II toxin-antitoxin system death-on-curing family toxin [Anaerotruncus sp.]|nr:type II toxin-antitoxin system death-on-curing family toxin [Anaerotruncus sp.]
MIFLTTEEIKRLHQKLLAATGGLPGVREDGLLESAIYSTLQTFGEQELYPSIHEKAAHLAFALINNHPFLDGNKRTGILAMLMILRLNGVSLSYSQAELIQLGLSIADGSLSYQDILKWICAHDQLAHAN